jgi:hypothetical protein
MKRLLVLLLTLIPTLAMAQHAQMSSSETQLGSRIVTFNQLDSIEGMVYNPAYGLDVLASGAYFIMAAPQVVTGKGCHNTWLTQNGQQVSNSNVQYCSQGPKQTDVIISQGVSCLTAGDIINVEQSGSGIKAIFPDGEPQIPSIIFTVFRIGDC